MRTIKMPAFLFWLCVALSAASNAYAFATPAPETPFAATGTVEYAFSPQDPVDDMIISAIGNARAEILVQAFSFTHRKIAQALINAHKRGVSVVLIADRRQTLHLRSAAVRDIANAGILVLLDGEHADAHNKVIVIDAASANNKDCAVVTGSYNFTYAAQNKNAENVLVLRGNAGLCAAYRENWQAHRAHTTSYTVKNSR